jgi:hypothetical protein
MGIAPRGEPTRDARGDFLADNEWSALRLPAPVFYQPDNVPAHSGGVLVGRLDTVDIGDDEITGAGEFLDGHPGLERLGPVIEEAMTLARDKMIAPSVDPSVMEFDIDADGRASITRADIAGVTLVPMPAFPNTWIHLQEPEAAGEERADDAAAPVLIAAVNREGHTNLPVAPRDRSWDGDGAAQRVAASCGVDTDDADDAAWNCYYRAFLYRDDDADAHTKGAYKLGFADIIDGELTIVPQGVIAVAGVLQGARGGADIPAAAQEELRGVVAALYEHINDALDTDLVPPWEADTAALIAAHVVEPVPADAFGDPKLGRYSPGFTVERGRIFGHVTHRDACYRGIAACVTPPESATGYAAARRYEIITDAGPLDVARITTGLGLVGPGCSCHDGRIVDDHYCPADRSAAAAMAHYDQLHTIADVVIGEADDGSVWAAGVLRDDLPAGAERVLQRRVWSGDWRPWGATSELIDVLALDHAEPGFTNRTKHDGTAYTLIAAAGPHTAPDPGDHIRAAIRAELDEREARRDLDAAITRAGLAAIVH